MNGTFNMSFFQKYGMALRNKLTPSCWRRYLRRRRSEEALGCYRSEQTSQKVLRVIFLFLLGLILALANYFVFVYYLSVDRMTSMYICSILATFLSFGLTFSERLRCITFLALPQLFTGRGRTMLLAYALITANTGILSNILHNFRAFTKSTVCLRNKLADLLPSPIYEKLNGSGSYFEQKSIYLNTSWTDLLTILKKIDKSYNETWCEIRLKYEWLKKKERKCKDLKHSLNTHVNLMISKLFQHWVVINLAHWLPITVKASAQEIINEDFQTICNLEVDDYVSLDNLLRTRIDNIKSYLMQQMKLNVSFNHRFDYNFISSKSVEDVERSIWEEITANMEIPLKIVNLFNYLFFGFGFFIFIKSFVYYRRYSRSAHYDNYYISKELRMLDSRRAFFDLPTILPVIGRERCLYVSNWSMHLVGSEKKKLIASIAMVVAAACPVAYLMLLDYTLNYMAEYFRCFKEMAIRIQEPFILGEGLFSIYLCGILEMFDPLFNYYIPPVALAQCMPLTRAPNYDVYFKIGGFFLVAVLFSLVGAWGLRTRHLIAAHYNPQMERVRAVWLHRKISSERDANFHLRSRSKICVLIRNPIQLLSMVLEYFIVKLSIIRQCLEIFGYQRKFCCLCGEGTNFDDVIYKECEGRECENVYCSDCLDILNNECVSCGKPIQDQLRDVDKEIDSSDEDAPSV